MKILKQYPLTIAVAILAAHSSIALASPAISGGIWFNYRYITDSDFSSAAYNSELDKETTGDITDEALILYIDDQAEGRSWSMSSEIRFGPGSLTDVQNNSTGDNFTIHKAWVGYRLNDHSQVQIGKSQVPFGWKTVNFWPGDLLLGGYGDQMDVGVKYHYANDQVGVDLAYFHADDWGETSTDTPDDNGHWGSSTTYRKIQTAVLNANYALTDQHTLGLSLQGGNLQDLSSYSTSPQDARIDGSHGAVNIYYLGTFGQFTTKAQVIRAKRELPNVVNAIENTRAALELSYRMDKWFYYLDSSAAKTDTLGNPAGNVQAHAVGVSYNYDPGWIYLEYLRSNGDIGRDGDIYEADFSAAYLTIDYYF